MRVAIMVLLCLAALTLVPLCHAAPPLPDPTAAFPGGIPPARPAVPLSPAGSTYSTGFEAAEGYVTGPIEPQLGWTASGNNSPSYAVSTAGPASGTRHLRMTATGVVNSPYLGALPPHDSRFSASIRISNDQGAMYWICGLDMSTGFKCFIVDFDREGVAPGSPGEIWIYDPNAMPEIWMSTGFQWTPGAYHRLVVEFDNSAGLITYYCNDVLIYVGSVFGGTSLQQFDVEAQGTRLTGEYLDLDDASIEDLHPPIPVEPTTWSRIKALGRGR